MNDSNDKTETKRAGGGTLTLKRPTTEQSKVKQSFSHGRTKTVVVETKRKRFGMTISGTGARRGSVQPKVAAPATTAHTQTNRSGVVLRTRRMRKGSSRSGSVGSRVARRKSARTE